MPWPNLYARFMSHVQTPAPSPYSVSLAISSASSSVLNVVTETTGPKISSWKMRIFQEEIFGPVVSVTTFKTLDEAVAIGNDTVYGLGAGVWSRNINNCYRVGRVIKAGRCWTKCYHVYPVKAGFGGYKESELERETHKQMLEHYQKTKNSLVRYSIKVMGLF